MPAHPRLTPEQAREVACRYSTGESLEALGSAFGVSYATIRNYLLRQGVVLRKPWRSQRQFSPKEASTIARKYTNGASMESIAREYQVATWAIRSTLQRLGVHQPGRRPRGAQHAAFKGGRVKAGRYIKVLVQPDDAFAEMRDSIGYVPEHRLVMAKALGRPLLDTETVHHIDGNPTNNDLSNLQLRSGHHGQGVTMRCLDCGSSNIKSIPLS